MSSKSLPPVGVVSLGCPKNLVDTEVMLGHLQRAGHAIVPDDEARVVLVNTCGFIDRAKEESVEAILEQVERKKRGEIDRVDRRRAAWSRSTGASSRPRSRRSTPSSGSTSSRTHRRRPRGSRRFRASRTSRWRPGSTTSWRRASCLAGGATRISRSARAATTPARSARSRRCGDCSGAGPSSRSSPRRGRSRRRASRSSFSSRRTRLATARTSELGRRGLARLVEALAAATGFPWIRFLYAYPKTLDDSVLDLMAVESRFLPYVDIPLQHVARPILSAMRRGGDAASYRRMIERMRERAPGIAIRTTFIVGFPGRGGGGILRALPSSSATRSSTTSERSPTRPEPGSGSEPLGDPVPAEEKERRRDFLLSLQQPIARAQAAFPAGARGRGHRRGALRGARRTCSKVGCAPRPPRSTGVSSSRTPEAGRSSRATSFASGSRRPSTTT